MTRRTPRPGDSFESKGQTVTVDRVSDGMVHGTISGAKPLLRWVWSLESFHEAIALATWGRA